MLHGVESDRPKGSSINIASVYGESFHSTPLLFINMNC